MAHTGMPTDMKRSHQSSDFSFISILGNIAWILLGGIFVSLQYFLSGIFLCLTIVFIPFGVQSFKLALLALLPFGRSYTGTYQENSVLYIFLNILWVLFFGIWIMATHFLFAVICAFTIVGLPFAKQHMKLAGLALKPFGQRIH